MGVSAREGSLRRLLAIGFAAKESSDVDEPDDHSVAKGIVRSEAVQMAKAIAARDARFPRSGGLALGAARYVSRYESERPRPHTLLVDCRRGGRLPSVEP